MCPTAVAVEISGGNRTPMELFSAGLRGWSGDIRQRLSLSTAQTFVTPKR
jgi:hypothetical protein